MKHAGKLSLAVGAVAIGTMALAAPAMATGPTASVSPNKNLVNGSSVTVKFSGYPVSASGVTVAAIQCSKPVTGTTPQQQLANAKKFCNIAGAKTDCADTYTLRHEQSANGLVVDYPTMARRIPATSAVTAEQRVGGPGSPRPGVSKP